MVSILRKLPKPREQSYEVADDALGAFKPVPRETQVAALGRGPPPYGQRSGWTPRSLADFGDGGAFPEIMSAQYPLDMGRKPTAAAKVVPLQVDANGVVAWDAVLKQGASADKLQVWTRPEDSREKWSKDEELARPEESIDIVNTERTQKALELALNGKIQAGLPQAHKSKAPEYVRYTPNLNAPGYNPNCAERVIRLSERPVDPLDPPKFRHKKVPRGPPSPPPPVHHSPARKLTAKDQKDWKIPACVSNWKNVKGYTIPLDKRLAADGRQLQDVVVNDKFAALSEDLYLAERKAREEIKIRNDMVRQKKVREEEVREQQLRDLAAQARQQRTELAAKPAEPGENAKEAEARQERMEVLNERKREIERDQRLELAGKKQKRGRDDDRDVSERIALGQAAQPTQQDTMYDSRLFNQSGGLDSGYRAGSDEINTVYDKPLFADRSKAGIYVHDKSRLEQNEGRLSHIGQSSFAGTEGQGTRSGGAAPVEFEEDEIQGAQSAPSGSTRDRDRDADRDRGRSRDRRRGGRDGEGQSAKSDPYDLDGLLEETKRGDKKDRKRDR